MDFSALSTIFNLMSTRTFWLFLVVFIVLWAFWRAQSRGELKWTDMITAPGTNKLSISKVGQAIGIVISSWAIIIMTDNNKLSSEIFGVWLAFLLGGAGWSSYLKSRNTRSRPDEYGGYGGYGGHGRYGSGSVYDEEGGGYEPDIPSVGPIPRADGKPEERKVLPKRPPKQPGPTEGGA
jgi:hypothetical protein